MSLLTPIRISSIRCSYYMVLALTDTGEALHWGYCSDHTVISRPRRVEGCPFPREVFAKGYYADSGGTVYLGKTILYETILFVHISPLTYPFHMRLGITRLCAIHFIGSFAFLQKYHLGPLLWNLAKIKLYLGYLYVICNHIL